MILIADSGSTKTDWVLTDGKNNLPFRTDGYNPYFISSGEICDSINASLPKDLNVLSVKKIFFYGAGCSSPENKNVVKLALAKQFPNAEVWVEHDMLAAARSLLGKERGLAAILGTGSNTCIYDGNQIEKNIDSLGYILGDEGSGGYIGKKIIGQYLRGYFPDELQVKFKGRYRLTRDGVFNALYNQSFPNRYLAAYCEFGADNKEHPFIKTIVKESFNDFFRNQVSKYRGYEKFRFNCVGSVALIFKDLLEEVCASYNIEPGKFIRAPIDHLVKFHTAR